MSKKMAVADRKKQLLEVALKLAEKHGYTALSRIQIANAAGVSETLPTLHFKSMPLFRKALMRAAIAAGNLKILAQGLALQDPIARKAPADLKEKALATLAG